MRSARFLQRLLARLLPDRTLQAPSNPAPPADFSQPAKRILVTGARGQVASMILPLWRGGNEASEMNLVLADRRGPRAERANLRHAVDCRAAVDGVDAVVHLAGCSTEASIEELWPDNVLATTRLLRSSVEAGVTRFVFASSMHVMGLYGRRERIDELMPARPDSHYATSKLHCEALCRLYGERYGMAVTCLRLGAVGHEVADVEPGSWISPQDVLAMIRIALAADRPWFEIFHAVADAPGSPLPPSRAAAFGYCCSRPGESYAASLARAQRWWPRDELARERRGAAFASMAPRRAKGPARLSSNS